MIKTYTITIELEVETPEREGAWELGQIACETLGEINWTRNIQVIKVSEKSLREESNHVY